MKPDGEIGPIGASSLEYDGPTFYTSGPPMPASSRKSTMSYLDGVWYSDENGEFAPINRYEAVDMLLKAINAIQEGKVGTVMEILCMSETYTLEEAGKLIPIRMKELSVQAQLELEIPSME